MKPTNAQNRLHALLTTTPRRPVGPTDKIVILSDLHMGSGRNDDFVHNGPLCLEALEHYYLARDFTLILNGDIEELLRNTKADIVKAWRPMYDLFDRFRAKNHLVWLQGNHEILPAETRGGGRPGWFDGESVLLELPNQGRIFVFHGHQAGVANSGRFNGLIGWCLKVFANGLGIGNRSIAHDSVKKFKLEKAVHEFSRTEELVSIIGHTHRPLFESLSKRESQVLQIERLCRDYTRSDGARRLRIRTAVKDLRDSLLNPTKGGPGLATTVYGTLPVPCVFNSGCAVGKRGFTTLEIKGGKIALVFWSTPDRSKLPQTYNEYKPSRRFGGAYRTILRRDALDYVFSRIHLLGEP